MPEETIKINGIEELLKIFNTLPVAVAKGAGVDAIKQAGKIVLEEARNLVPEKSGKLKKSLAVQQVKVGYPVVKVLARRAKGMGGYHAHLIELGTKPHIIPGPVKLGKKWYKNISHPGTQKKPFLRPALLNKKYEAIKKTFEVIFPAIEKRMKKFLAK